MGPSWSILISISGTASSLLLFDSSDTVRSLRQIDPGGAKKGIDHFITHEKL